MSLELTIRRRGSLLSRVMERQVTQDQSELVGTLLDCTDGLNSKDMLRLTSAVHLTLLTLGNGTEPWAETYAEGAGESVEAFRG